MYDLSFTCKFIETIVGRTSQATEFRNTVGLLYAHNNIVTNDSHTRSSVSQPGHLIIVIYVFESKVYNECTMFVSLVLGTKIVFYFAVILLTIIWVLGK